MSSTTDWEAFLAAASVDLAQSCTGSVVPSRWRTGDRGGKTGETAVNWGHWINAISARSLDLIFIDLGFVGRSFGTVRLIIRLSVVYLTSAAKAPPVVLEVGLFQMAAHGWIPGSRLFARSSGSFPFSCPIYDPQSADSYRILCLNGCLRTLIARINS